jgi:hypothetical protein
MQLAVGLEGFFPIAGDLYDSDLIFSAPLAVARNPSRLNDQASASAASVRMDAPARPPAFQGAVLESRN